MAIPSSSESFLPLTSRHPLLLFWPLLSLLCWTLIFPTSSQCPHPSLCTIIIQKAFKGHRCQVHSQWFRSNSQRRPQAWVCSWTPPGGSHVPPGLRIAAIKCCNTHGSVPRPLLLLSTLTFWEISASSPVALSAFYKLVSQLGFIWKQSLNQTLGYREFI